MIPLAGLVAPMFCFLVVDGMVAGVVGAACGIMVEPTMSTSTR